MTMAPEAESANSAADSALRGILKNTFETHACDSLVTPLLRHPVTKLIEATRGHCPLIEENRSFIASFMSLFGWLPVHSSCLVPNLWGFYVRDFSFCGLLTVQ